MGKILVIDDDKNILKVLKRRLEANDYEVVTADDEETAIDIAKDEVFDLSMIDYKLTNKDGIEMMEDLHKINPDMPVIILTAYGTINNAVDAMKRGASSYLTKPFDDHELLLQIKNCLEKAKLPKEVKQQKNIVRKMHSTEDIIGKSKGMKKVMEKVLQAAKTDSNVYVYGESGTGKELIARNLHVSSKRKDGPFVAINCAAIPDTLIESELFGYEKGAFTGANGSKKGLFAQADNGTFFLDEISEMPITMQAKLLRVLEEKEFYPIGSEKPLKVDIRIVVASNKDLKEEIKSGNFREDLFYRIHVIYLKLPPLRERKEDVLLLAKHFLSEFKKKMNKEIKEFSLSASQKLMLYHWPGNVRELENTVECAVAMSTGNVITDDLILPVQKSENERLKLLRDAKEEFEKDYLIQLCELTQGNVSKAAKLSGKYRADLYELLKKYDIKPDSFRRK